MEERPVLRPRVRLLVLVLALVALGTIGAAGFVILRERWMYDPLGGAWQGGGWGTLQLERSFIGYYEGTYTGTRGKAIGRVRLSQAAEPNRWEGTWGEGDYRRGTFELTANPESKMLIGRYSADPDCQHLPGQPRSKPFTLFRPKELMELRALVSPFMSVIECKSEWNTLTAP